MFPVSLNGMQFELFLADYVLSLSLHCPIQPPTKMLSNSSRLVPICSFKGDMHPLVKSLFWGTELEMREIRILYSVSLLSMTPDPIPFRPDPDKTRNVCQQKK